MNDTENLLSSHKFSQLTGLPWSTLRFYDREGLLSPTVRDQFTGYRYYAPQQITTANFIRQCVFWRIPLAEVKQMIRSRTPSDFRHFLKSRRRVLLDQLKNISEQLSALYVYENHIDMGLDADESSIRVQQLAPLRLRLGGENEFDDRSRFYETLSNFISTAPETSRYFPIARFFTDIEAYFSAPTKPTRFALIDPNGEIEKPSGVYLVGYSRGYYGQPSTLPHQLSEYALANHYEFSGPVYKIYLHDEICISDPNQYLFQVSVQVKDLA